MRATIALLCLGALAPALLSGTAAFTWGETSRGVVVTIVGDGSAYLALAPNTGSPHDCFVDESAGGKMSVTFDAVTAECSTGTGAGIAQGDGSNSAKYSRYSFHDILVVTNKGTKAITVWANATTTSAGGSSVEVAKRASGTMSDADYYTTSATGISLGVGVTGYLGVRVKSGTLTSGNDVTGTITVEGRRS